MQLLVPLLVEMACPLRYLVAVHDVQDLVSDSLSVAGAFTDESKHGSEKISRGKEMLLSVASRCTDRPLILLAQLVGEADLGMLKFSGLGVEAPLPRELPGEAVSKPDEEEHDVVTAGDVHLAAAEQFSATMVPVHESPGAVVDLTVQDLVDCLSNLASRNSGELSITLRTHWFEARAEHN